ncbi:MAG: hypothetical protein IJD48_00190 [Clostridia bacterium]|nr:hypothetical protein [Clostridia bacterium]
MKNAKLASILLLNLVSNTKALSNVFDAMGQERGEDTPFYSLFPQDLYIRLLSDIKFSELSESQKSTFLFLRKDKEHEVDKQDLYNYEMQFFAKEAHNRTAAVLKAPRTNIVFCDFSKSRSMRGDSWVLFDGYNDNIYINLNKDYSRSRPSFLLENINGATRHHSIVNSIFKGLESPEAIDDREMFLALSTAVKFYVYQELKENDPVAYNYQIGADHSTPINIEEIVYSFVKTRQDFQAAGLYGGQLREDLRRNEETFHQILQEELVVESLINMEDIFEYFNKSELNENSGGLLGKILESLVNQTAYAFYNSIGAEMQPGQSISNYIDGLEREMFDEYGIEPPEDSQLEEENQNFDPHERTIEEHIRNMQTGYSEEENVEDRFFYDDEETDESMPDFKDMKSALPLEGKIYDIKVLPFHNQTDSSQATAQ